MRIGIVVTTYNGLKNLTECLTSIQTASDPWVFTVVVDNGSRDNTSEIIKMNFPEITIIRSEVNLGFGGGNNLGCQTLIDRGVDVIVMLNNDVVMESDFFKCLREVVQRYKGPIAVAPKILNYYNPSILDSAGGRISLLRCTPIVRGYRERDYLRYDAEERTSSISGPAIIINRSTIDIIGFLNPRFFLGAEDIDYSLRIIKAGIPIIYAPSVRIHHKGSQSSINKKTGVVATQLDNFFGTRNSLILLGMHGNVPQRVGHAFVLFLVLMPWRALRSVLSHHAFLKPTLLGIVSRLNPTRVPPDHEIVARFLG